MRKRLACLVCALALVWAIPSPCAMGYSLSTVTLRVLEDNVMLYKNPTGLPSDELFAMTKGYFAVASEYDENYWQVTYQHAENGYLPVVGYLKKEQAVVYTDPQPAILYPDFTATALFNNTFLYENCGSEVIGVLVKGQTAKCYGFLTQGEEVYVYAKCGTLFGYLPCSKLQLTEIAEHPVPLPKDPEEENPPDDDPKDDEPQPKDDKLQILLILAIVIPSLVIIYIMLRPKKKRF